MLFRKSKKVTKEKAPTSRLNCDSDIANFSPTLTEASDIQIASTALSQTTDFVFFIIPST